MYFSYSFSKLKQHYSEHKNIEVQGLQNVAYLKALSPDDIVKNTRTGICIDPSSIDDTYAGETKEEKTNTSTRSNNMSSLTRAREVMKADDISFNTKFHCFNVNGTSGTTRVVTLFPKETCSCPATGDCYHLLAVRMSLGMTELKKELKYNLTQLRKNTKSRKDKRSGRKRPRPNDEDLMLCCKGRNNNYCIAVIYSQAL